MEVFCQRLHQEHGTESILTSPSVTYKIKMKPTKQNVKDGTEIIYINNPAHFPDHIAIEECFEPIVTGNFLMYVPNPCLSPFFNALSVLPFSS